LRGNIEFGFGPEVSVAVPGSLVHVPAGTVHWFRFGKGGGEMISMTSRAGASAFFADVDREIPPGPPDFTKLAGIATRHGLQVNALKH
jgi:hypothetical protein